MSAYRPRAKSRASSYQRCSGQSSGPAARSAARKSIVALHPDVRSDRAASVLEVACCRTTRTASRNPCTSCATRRRRAGRSRGTRPDAAAVRAAAKYASHVSGTAILRGLEMSGDVGEVVRLAVHGDLEQRPARRAGCRSGRPSGSRRGARRRSRRDGRHRSCWLRKSSRGWTKPAASVFPDENRAGHEDIGTVSATQVAVESHSRSTRRSGRCGCRARARCCSFELGRVTLDARDVSVGVGRQEPHGRHAVTS